MILLDTNVLSALMQEPADKKIVDWLNGVPVESVWTTSISLFEIRFWLELLVSGRRRQRLERAFGDLVADDLEDRVVPFDRMAADTAAVIAATMRRRGRSIEFRDVQIAGIAMARRASLATRNVRHFDGLGLALIDPWTA